MRGRLLGHEIRDDAPLHEHGVDIRGVRAEGDADRAVLLLRSLEARERGVEIVGALVDVARVEALLDARGIDLDGEARHPRHRRGERLRAAHAAEARGEDPQVSGALRPLDVRLTRGDEGLVGALQDALRADVDPRAGRHLAVHDEALLLELAEVLPGGPLADEVRVRDEHARGVGVRLEAADRLARLHEQGLVALEVRELARDDVERLPRSRGLAGPAVDHEVLGALGDLGVEVVVEHAERRLLHPSLARERRSARSRDRSSHARCLARASGGWNIPSARRQRGAAAGARPRK